MAYDRPWKSFDEQLTLLKTRGMCVTNDQAAKNYLERVGYYRLSGYWYPFRQFLFVQDPSTGSSTSKALDQFHLNTHFSDAVKLYLFDKVIRLLVFASWLRSLNHLRNIAAHHSRLWNRNIVDQPKLPKLGEIAWCDGFLGKSDLIAKPFLLFAILRHMVCVISPKTSWHIRLADHLDSFPELQSDQKRTLHDIGVTDDWKAWWFGE